MLEYRDFLSLTDEEIAFIISDIFPATPRVDNIERDTKGKSISCDIYIMDEYPDIPDTLDLTPDDITTHDFKVDRDDVWRWQQYLLAKGCDERLKNNPYLHEKSKEELAKESPLRTGMVIHCENEKERVFLFKELCRIGNMEETWDNSLDNFIDTDLDYEIRDLQKDVWKFVFPSDKRTVIPFSSIFPEKVGKLVMDEENKAAETVKESPIRPGMIIRCENIKERIALYEELCRIGNMTDLRYDCLENFIDTDMNYIIKDLQNDVWGITLEDRMAIPFSSLFPEKAKELSEELEDEHDFD